ncbi:ATP-binding protein [Variovorax sp. KBW07]|uniref:AAA family ATPase n=1 Tax=Variovorax sp. KBW07 TaxID=2153358 RepID=UPI0021AAECE9|nr:ATP-binding protein [Variovorax sp. KBW07]
MVCGKIGAGKSTLTRRLAQEPATVLISEDAWLDALYPGEIRELPDYVRASGRLKQAMASHVSALLAAGVSVVLDFPANTLGNRAWARGIFEAAGAAHQLHFLDVPDEVCKQRLRARNASGEHPFETSDAQFDMITRHFVAPTADEGFQVVRHA